MLSVGELGVVVAAFLGAALALRKPLMTYLVDPRPLTGAIRPLFHCQTDENVYD